MAKANQTASSVLVALCLLALAAKHAAAMSPRLVPAVFVFGDSTVDVGNNNDRNINKAARANYPQNGVDFPDSRPTGRFSNGYNTADQLAQLLGFPMSPPAYLSVTEYAMASRMYKGFNFASGGSGLANKTGLLAGEVIPMSMQVEFFSLVVEHMHSLWGPRKTARFLSGSIFLISTGSNDMFEYSFTCGDDNEFLLGLVASYKCHLKALYLLGVRKFSIISIPPLGCTPAQRARRLAQNGTMGCFDQLNDLSLQSYPMVAAMLEELADELPGMRYSLANAFTMVSFILANPRTNAWSFTELEFACCGAGQFAASGCNETAPLCANRGDHLFWDANHPTEAVSAIAARTLFLGSRAFVSPINVRELASL